jgi:[glutamine synthetase] adenylyltransferase / [glutamine synthetase]-adenylyl-L-tyrosine phosphorylase
LARASAATVARLGPPPVDAQGEPVPLVVVGLGKLGGSELGYASDLDLLFVYGDAADPAAAADWFARLAQKFIHWLSHQGAGGRLYSIDTRLRPSGSQGPLVVSLAALERYHEGEAALWERQALSRARVIAWTTGAAGEDDPVREPPVVGRLKRALDRSVYERPLPSDAGAQFADMRRRLEAHNIRPRPAPCDAETDIKYGAGGLLDIEFLAQYGALTVGAAGQAGQAGQATWAALQAGNTRETLSALGTVGFLPLTDAAFLADAYDRLRRLESRVVLARGCEAPSRTGVNDARWAVVARRMGYTATAPSQAVATLWTDIALMRARVRELFKTVVG